MEIRESTIPSDVLEVFSTHVYGNTPVAVVDLTGHETYVTRAVSGLIIDSIHLIIHAIPIRQSLAVADELSRVVPCWVHPVFVLREARIALRNESMEHVVMPAAVKVS